MPQESIPSMDFALRPMMQQQLTEMLELQEQMNCRVHPDWKAQEFAWYRALWLECAELVDHYGYKWWKRQVPDLQQVRLEVVDIWHFGLSMLLDGRCPEHIADELLGELSTGFIPDVGVLEAAEALAQQALTTRRFSVVLFWSLVGATELDFSTLYQGYIGKNVLNFFRQDHGYQQGSYVKQWSDREDNEHLSELIDVMDSSAPDFADQLYQALAQRYLEHVPV